MKHLNLLMIIGTVAVLTGCAQPEPYIPSVNTVSNADSSAVIKRVVDRRVDTDPYLAQSLYVTEIRESRTNDGYKRIQIFLKNYAGSNYSFIYRFNWYDENGVELENPDKELWVRKAVVAGDDVTLTSIAPRQNCRDFKLRIKAAY